MLWEVWKKKNDIKTFKEKSNILYKILSGQTTELHKIKDVTIKNKAQALILISYFEICENQSDVIKEYIIKCKLFS